MTSAAWRSLTSLGELTLLFLAALRGSFRRPFYWRELLEQCRFILTANFLPLLLTGPGFGTSRPVTSSAPPAPSTGSGASR